MRIRPHLLAAIGFVAGALVALPMAAPAASKNSNADGKPEPPPLVRPAWSISPGGAVEWQRVAPLGQLLVKTSTNVSAIDPVSGRVLWTRDAMGTFAEDTYEEIPGSSLVAMSDGMQKPRTVVLDSVDGRVVFDSRAAGVEQVLSRHFMPKSRALLLFGFRVGKPVTTMFLVDVDSGRLLWENDQLLAGQSKFAVKLTHFLQAAANASGVTADPLEVAAGTFLFASSADTYAVDTRTGNIKWKTPLPSGAKKTRFYTTERTPGVVYIGSETATSSGMSTSSGGQTEMIYTLYQAHRLQDGAKVWAKEARVKGGLNDVIFTAKGLALSGRTTGKGKIVLCDYATGEGQWGKKGKGLEILGGIVAQQPTPAGLVLTTGYDSAWSNKGAEYYLSLLDVNSGTLRFEEPLRLRGRVLTTRMVPKGLLFTTTSEADIMDLSTGKAILDGALRSDESLVTAESGRYLYAYAGKSGLLHRLDTEAATVSTLSRVPAKLEEDEAPESMEIENGRVTVLSSQNVLAWSEGGEMLVKSYHPSPKLPVMMRVLLRAEQVRMGMAAAAAGMAGVTFAQVANKTAPESVERAVTATMATGYASAAEQAVNLSARYGEAARTRFKASTVVPDYVFMLVKPDRGPSALAQVSKEDGRVLGMVDLGSDREPVYEVDAVTGMVFYRATSQTVAGYRFP
ncbi:MAG TPA: PQQ-binding-like beta-propeller repeat protein [Dongiaceae bacterium]|nr:PQQ-binding-like beta-propeller repeat protein [Dongiaceae bacterium]